LLVIGLAKPALADMMLTFMPGAGTDLSNLTVNQSFYLQVYLSGLTTQQLAYMEVTISSNSALLQLAGGTAGPVIPIGLGSTGGATLITYQADPTHIFFGAYGNYNPGPYMTTNGLVGTLHLKALAPGSGTFGMSGLNSFDVVAYGDAPIDISSSLGYSVAAPVATLPEPSAVVLLATVGVLLAFRQRLGKTGAAWRT
jgi:hypothetical protein